MTPLYVLIAATTIGIEAGWAPLPEGGHEYTIQVEPSLLSVLEGGNDLTSEVPAQVNVRRFRITVGTGSLARIDGEPEAPPTEVAAAPSSGDEPPSSPDESLAADKTTAGGANEPTLAEPRAPTDSTAADGSTIPARFEDPGTGAQPLEKEPAAAGSDAAPPHNTEKPRLEAGVGEPAPPWMPLAVAALLLALSLGANFYLGWIYVGARNRYREAVARLRTMPAAG